MIKFSLSGIAKFGLKAVVSISLIWWLLSGIDLADLWSHLSEFSLVVFLLLLIFFLATIVLQTLRWRIVLKCQGLLVSLQLALSLTMLGQFFNQILPSTVGSDIVRVWGIHRNGAPLSTTANAAIVDRLIALMALVVMGIVGLPLLAYLDAESAATWSVVFVSLTGAAAILVILVIRFTPLRRIDWVPVRGIVSVSASLWNLLSNRNAATGTLGLSLAIHGGVVLMAFVIGQSMGATADLAGYFVVLPPIILISSLPISIAGWGVRESVAVIGLGLLGISVEVAIAISIILGGIAAVAGLLGGGFWLIEKSFYRRET